MEKLKEDVKKIIELNNFNSTVKAKLIHALYTDNNDNDEDKKVSDAPAREEFKVRKPRTPTKRGKRSNKSYTQEEINDMVETLIKARTKDKTKREVLISKSTGRTPIAIKIFFNGVLRKDKTITGNLRTEPLRKVLSHEPVTKTALSDEPRPKKRRKYNKLTQTELETIKKERHMGRSYKEIAKLLNTTPLRIKYIVQRNNLQGMKKTKQELRQEADDTVEVGESTRMPRKTSYFN